MLTLVCWLALAAVVGAITWFAVTAFIPPWGTTQLGNLVLGFAAHHHIADIPESLRLVRRTGRDGLDAICVTDLVAPRDSPRRPRRALRFILGRTQPIAGTGRGLIVSSQNE